MTAHRLVRADGLHPEQAAAQSHVRAALLAAMATTIPLFHEHLSRALGVDIFTPEGDRLVNQAVLDIFARQLNDDEPASASAGVRREIELALFAIGPLEWRQSLHSWASSAKDRSRSWWLCVMVVTMISSA